MFKGRLGLWIWLVVLCFVAQMLIVFVPTWIESTDVYVSANVETDDNLSHVLSNEKINGIKIHMQNENPDVIIETNATNRANYTVHEDYLYSPLVLYVRAAVDDNNEGFIRVPGSSYCFKADLHAILTAIEQDKTWQDIGISKKVANGPVTLYIPNENSAYYDEVIELFYLTLNCGKVPSNSEMFELSTRINAVIEKCNMVADVVQEISNEYSEPSNSYKVFIGPEYLFKRGVTYSMGTDNSDSDCFHPVYLLNTVFLKADVSVKNTNGSSNVGESFVSNMNEKRQFMSKTGWRVKNSTFDLYDCSIVYFETPQEFEVAGKMPNLTEATNKAAESKTSDKASDNTDERSVVKQDVEPTVAETVETTEVTSEPTAENLSNVEVEEAETEVEETSDDGEGSDIPWPITVLLVILGIMFLAMIVTMILEL